MFIDEFFNETRISRSQGTAITYRRIIQQFLVRLSERNIKLEVFGQDDFQKLVVEMVDAKKAPAYVRLVANSVIVYFKWLRERGLGVYDLKRPKLPKIQKINPLSMQESVLPAYARVVRGLPEPYSTALLLLPLCGLRSFEIAELRLADLRYEPPWVFLTVMGKGKKERVVPLVQSANPIIKAYLTGWRAGIDQTPWLFPNPRKILEPMPTRKLRLHIQRCGERVGVPLSPHTMRHTYLTILRRRGIVGERLARLAGHTDSNFTEERYVTKEVGDLCKELEDIDIAL